MKEKISAVNCKPRVKGGGFFFLCDLTYFIIKGHNTWRPQTVMWSHCMEVVRTSSVRDWGLEGRESEFSDGRRGEQGQSEREREGGKDESILVPG